MLHDTAPPSWRPGDPVAVLVHGLGGCHRSGGIVRLARLLFGRGIRVGAAGPARHRGRVCAGPRLLQRRLLGRRAGGTARRFIGSAPTSPIWLAGISLGGNVALKLAGETAEHPVPNLARIAAIAPPVDLEHCLALLMHPRNRMYERHFVRELLTLARRRARLFPDQPLPTVSAAEHRCEHSTTFTPPRGPDFGTPPSITPGRRRLNSCRRSVCRR